MSDITAWATSFSRTVVLYPLVIVVSVGIVLLLALAFGSRLFPGTRLVRNRLWCPVRAKRMRVDVAVTAWDGRAVDVAACAAFSPPDAVTCERRCLELNHVNPEGDRLASGSR
jgi:hypothetical protein